MKRLGMSSGAAAWVFACAPPCDAALAARKSEVVGETCARTWVPTFGAQPGTSGPVKALATYDDGAGTGLYLGGQFTSAGGVAANFVARWDGSSWSALGSGTNGSVFALAVYDDGNGPALYAGGEFTSAGGGPASGIARWDGKAWSEVGGGLDGPVGPLAVYDDGSGPALYAAGAFTSAGGTKVNNIARWDGSSWSALGEGTGGPVLSLAVYDDGSGGGPALYAGGAFTTAGGAAASRIARWDGSSWSALGSGADGWVYALRVHDDGSGGGPSLYAGGAFTSAGGAPANFVARWDGASWSALGSGTYGTVYALTVHDDGGGGGPVLHAGGAFTTAGGWAANFVARWDGKDWSAMADGTNSPVLAFASYDDGSGGGSILFAAGEFTTAGALPASYVARWDTSWSAVSGATGLNAPVRALAVHDDGSGPGLYAGGLFSSAGGGEANAVARWDGASWSEVGGGMNDAVVALAVHDAGDGPALYAGGAFTIAGGQPADSLARWDGAAWSALGGEVNGAVFALSSHDDGGGPGLYAGGAFTSAGGADARFIARWDGKAWSALGSGLNGYVYALAVYDDGRGAGPAVYAGGDFSSAGGQPASAIARWDGKAWSALGSGVSGGFVIDVYALAVFDDGEGPALYAGGIFNNAGGVSVNSIARWDGSTWSALAGGVGGGGFVSAVTSLAVLDDARAPVLCAGGNFTTAGGVPASRIAQWDGASWSALGSGVDDFVYVLSGYDDGEGPALHAGGAFGSAIDSGDSYVAKWSCGPPCAGDATLDGTVDVEDVIVVILGWGDCQDPPAICTADLDGDGAVNMDDLMVVIDNWGPCE